MRSLTAVVVGLLAVACSQARDPELSPPPGFRYEMSPARPQPGDTVVLTLTNSDAPDSGYNLCTSALMVETGEAWIPVPSDRVCTMELRILSRGQRDSFPIPVPPDLRAGRYRFETQLEDLSAGTRQTIVTEPFTIAG